jgi:predicted amidohydrolase
MQDLTLTFIQAELVWEDTETNLANFDRKIDDIAETTDLIILPEMFNTGFSINPEGIAEPPDGKTFSWMQETAAQKNAALAGSVLTEEDGKYYNRFYWVNPDGTHQQYDKKHLFRIGKEWQVFTPGKEKTIVNFKGWKTLPLVCYDLRFPVWSKNRLIDGEYEYDLAIYVANWPIPRIYAWRQLLIARAIENLAYVVGVNRVGKAAGNIDHSGDSMLVDALGHVIAKAEPHKEEIISANISKTERDKTRDKLPFAMDWDAFEV